MWSESQRILSRKVSGNPTGANDGGIVRDIEPGNIAKHVVGGDEDCLGVDGGRGDPQVCVMGTVRKGMTDCSASEPQRGDGVQDIVGDREHGRGSDRRLEPRTALLGPPGDEGAVAKLGDGLDGEEELVTDEPGNQGLQVRSAAAGERGAEHAGVDQEPHSASAARNRS